MADKLLRARLPKNHTPEQWITAEYYNKFGSQEFLYMYNTREYAWCKEWWKKNVVEHPDGVISVKDFQQWFYELHNRRPRRFKADNWAIQMITTWMVLGPRSFEEAESIKQKKAWAKINSQNNTSNDSQELVK